MEFILLAILFHFSAPKEFGTIHNPTDHNRTIVSDVNAQLMHVYNYTKYGYYTSVRFLKNQLKYVKAPQRVMLTIIWQIPEAYGFATILNGSHTSKINGYS